MSEALSFLSFKATTKALLIQLAICFIITQFLGLFLAYKMLPQEELRVTIASENPNAVENAFVLVAYILVFTAFLLFVIFFLKGLFGIIIRLMEFLALFASGTIVFSVLLDSAIIGLILAIGFIVLREIFRKKIIVKNIAAIIAISGVGTIIGLSLGILPTIIFLILLSVYDLIAVFKTKHMIVLAKQITKRNAAFTIAMPTKEHVFELGTGDFVLPLVFVVSVFSFSNAAIPLRLIACCIIALSSLIGLILTAYICSKNVGIVLPALPPQGSLMLFTFGILNLLSVV